MIDLRSDTLTQPTAAMLAAQAAATGGDDSRDGDPTVARLEAEAARLLGKEAGLFMVSGTMGNLVALLAHGGRGGEVLLDAGSHLLRSEVGGVAVLGGLMPRALPARRGAVDLGALRAALQPGPAPARLQTALVWMETTHNDAGGAALPLAHMQAVAAAAREAGVPVHIDGARFLNAALAIGEDPAALAATADSISICISKGLSAPIGGVLVGSAAFIARARPFRRMLGGALRQAGGLAACGLLALERRAELAADHAAARLLADGLASLDPRLCRPEDTDSNIVRIDTSGTAWTAAEWAAQLERHGVRVGAWDVTQLRAVTHRHTGTAEIHRALAAFRSVLEMRRAA